MESQWHDSQHVYYYFDTGIDSLLLVTFRISNASSDVWRDLFQLIVFTEEKVNEFGCRIHAIKQGYFLLNNGKQLIVKIRVFLAIYYKMLLVFDVATTTNETPRFVCGNIFPLSSLDSQVIFSIISIQAKMALN